MASSEPTLKRIKTTNYWRDPETGQLYSLYQVRVTWPNGRQECFDSEIQAKAAIEGKPVPQLDVAKLLAEA